MFVREKLEIKATLVELEGVVCLVHPELTALPEDQVLQELMALMETPDDLESQELWVILVSSRLLVCFSDFLLVRIQYINLLQVFCAASSMSQLVLSA